MAESDKKVGFFSKTEEKKGLFSGLVKGPNMTFEEAFLAILVGAAQADGIVCAEEAEELAALIHRTNTFSKQPPSDVSKLQEGIRQKIDRDGLETVLTAACSAILTSADQENVVVQRAESVFTHAVDIVFADRQVRPSEQKYIESLGQKLKINEERGQIIVSVIEVKNAF